MAAFPLGDPDDGVQRALRILNSPQTPYEEELVETHDAFWDAISGEIEGLKTQLANDVARMDQNAVILEKAITAAPPAARSGSEARIDPDDIRLFWVTLGLTGAFALAAFAASFSGQLAMARNTFLPGYLHFLVPLFIDLPIVVVSLAILIFRRRRESTLASWLLLGILTAASSAINAVHVLDQAGALAGAPLTLPVLLGTGVMAAAPVLVLLSWEQLARLAVKPNPEEK